VQRPLRWYATFSALGLLVPLLTCSCHNPCRDGDSRIVNVNDYSFAGGALRVVSYNLLHGLADAVNDRSLDGRLDVVADALASLRPHVVLLQEASVTSAEAHCNVVDTLRGALNERLAGTEHSYNSTQAARLGSAMIDFHEGPAVLSRAQILEAALHEYVPQIAIPPERRVALRATLRGTAQNIDVVSTHLTNQDQRDGDQLVRTLQAEELAREVLPRRPASLPLVVGGDFNAPPGSGTVGAMIGADFVDVWAAARPGEAGFTSLAGPISDTAARPDSRIDYLFVEAGRTSVTSAELFLDAPAGTLTEEGLVELWPSDHVGVVGEIVIGQAP